MFQCNIITILNQPPPNATITNPLALLPTPQTKKENYALPRERHLDSKYYLRLIFFKEKSKLREKDFRNIQKLMLFIFFPHA